MGFLMFNPAGQVTLIITSILVVDIRHPSPTYHFTRHLREEKLPAVFLLVFSCGRLAPLLKAPSLFRGQYLQKTIEYGEEMCANVCHQCEVYDNVRHLAAAPLACWSVSRHCCFSDCLNWQNWLKSSGSVLLMISVTWGKVSVTVWMNTERSCQRKLLPYGNLVAATV